MRRKLVAGNWKMNLSRSDAVALAAAVKGGVETVEVDVAVCPSYVHLDAVGRELAGSRIGLGAQDVYFEKPGAFTGEISTSMLLDVGCQFVVLGHSERRNVIGENNDQINRKIHAALEAGLSPILCVGELLEQREAGETLKVVQDQFQGSLADVSAAQMSNVVVAYEPVWAIGTGVTATPEQAQEVHADLRKIIADQYNSELTGKTRILYGGSVKPENAADLMSQTDIDGALVGGASLKADQFLQIITSANSIMMT